MEMIRRGKAGEGERLRAFADVCFRKENDGSNFEKLVPKLYRKPEETVGKHFLLEEDGEIKGLICPDVTVWCVGGQRLKVGHIGTVCVTEEYRERGAMRQLMTKAIEELKKEGCALAVLCGQRQRYEHYDFVPTGVKTEFFFEPKNIKGVKAEGYSLRPMTEADLELVQQLHQENDPHMERNRSGFMDILHNWSASPMVLCKGARVYGYCTVMSDEGANAVTELRLEKPELLKILIRLLFEKGYTGLRISLGPLAPEYGLAGEFCGKYAIGQNYNIRVLQFAPLVEALLSRKAQQYPLPQGKVELSIEGYGRLSISLEAKGARVQLCENEPGPKEMRLKYQQAVHVLFSSMSPRREQLVESQPLVAAWLPLPLFVEENDCI